MLEIDRLSLEVRAAASSERAELLGRRLRDAALRGIERDRYALSPPGSPAYLFVERLAVRCAVATEWDDAAIGAEVARALASALEGSAAAPQALAFRDHAELLAAFYSALAEGRAWRCWWFDTFDGLKALPASAALRTSVVNEEPHGLTALARLTGTALGAVLRILSDADVARLLEWLERRPATARAASAALWRVSASPSTSAGDIGLLKMLIAVEHQAPGAANGDTLRMLRSMMSLRAAAARGELGPGSLIREDALNSLRGALAALALEAYWLQRLTESDAAAIVEELSRLSTHSETPSSRQGSQSTGTSIPGERLFTPRGGVFVLLKALDWLGWPEQWARAAGNDALARALAWAVALRALEPHGAPGLRDTALQQAFDLDSPVKLLKANRAALAQLLAGKTILQASRTLLEHLSSRIPGLAGASAEYVRGNALALPATVERRAGGCVVRLGRAPLDILLVLAGANSGRIALPGAALELRAEPPA